MHGAWVPRLLLGSKVAVAWQTTQSHLVLKFRLSEATPQTPSPCLQSRYSTTFPFSLF